MKRNITAAVLFGLLIIVSSLQLVLLKNATKRFCGVIDSCEQYVISDSTSEPDPLAEIGGSWEEYYGLVSYLTHSDTLEDMAETISRLKHISDKDELSGELSSLRTMALLICDGQVPHLRSIF